MVNDASTSFPFVLLLPTCSHGQTRVDTVASLVSTNGIPLCRMTNGTDYGASDFRIGMAPRNGYGVDAKGIGVRGDWNVITLGKLGLGNVVGFCHKCKKGCENICRTTN